MVHRVRTRDEHYTDPGPKRILALDGGGVRGILTLGYLSRIEDILRARHGGDSAFRLAHYYDLIAGTSTGAIIAAALATGMTVAEVRERYLSLGSSVFRRSIFRRGVVRAKFDEEPLVRELKAVFGDATLGDPRLLTGLLVVTKRLDTGSPWPISNNPNGRYYGPREGSKSLPNSEYPLWQVVRASTAAPSFFEPERITIADSMRGVFVDGGVSPHNNPALQALMFVTLEGYRVGWQMSEDQLMLTSVGTGRGSPAVGGSDVAGKHAFLALLSLMDDNADLVEVLLQWMSRSATARVIDRELGALSNDLLAPEPLLTYRRYNVTLTVDGLPPVVALDELESRFDGVTQDRIAALAAMDDPGNMPLLDEIGRLAAARQVAEDQFPEGFDLPA